MSRISRQLACVLALLCVSATSAHSSPQLVDPQRFRESQPGGVYLRTLRNAWNLSGYGRLLRLTANSATLYNYAGDLCWRDPLLSGDPARSTVTAYYAFPRRPLSVNFAMTPDGTQYPAQWMPFIPAACLRAPDTSPLFAFEAVAATLQDYYPFASARGVNWNERITRLRPQAQAAHGDAELKAVMEQLLDGLQDAHTTLRGNAGGADFEIAGESKFTFARLREEFAQQSGSGDFFEYLLAWRAQQQEMVFDTLETVSRRRALNGNVIWGKLPGEVGYLAVEQMSEFEEGASLSRDRELLASTLDHALSDLAGTRAIILDVSNNLGGWDQVANDIAARFTDVAVVAYSKKAHSPRPTPEQTFTIKPAAARRYTRPVLLLTSDMTVSAGEVLALSMRNFPQVRHVGSATQGALSDVLLKGLPNGWLFGTSSEIYRDPHGRSYEVSGIPPTVEYPVYRSTDFDLGRLNAVLRAQQLALSGQ
ncbi:MAG: S41 family peptidase [Rhodanobacteraceae bacterium]|nr:S41 family peptidase [Rhodanobacteraceae bacterium]